MIKIKQLLFPILTGLIYILIIGTVFFGSASISDIGTTIGLELILFIFLPFVLITHKASNILTSSYMVLGRGILLSLIAYITHTTPHSVFILLSHLTIAGYLRSWQYRVLLSKKRYYWGTSHHGLSMAATLLTFTYASTIRIAGATITLNCDDLYSQSIGFINQLIPSLNDDSQIIQKVGQASLIGTKSIGEILGTHNTSGELLMPLQIKNPLSKTGMIILQSTPPNNDESLLAGLLSYQQQVIDNISDNQNLINQQVCDITLSHITQLMSKNNAKLVAFILLNLLLYVFINALFFIVGIINYILIQFLFRTGRFHRVKVEGTYEKITL